MNPKTTKFEFLGPPGTLFITLTVPVVAYALYFGCSEETGGCPPIIDTNRVLEALTRPAWWAGLWDTQATLLYLGWYAYCMLSWVILPGDWMEGTTLRDGTKKKYKINAFSSLLLALGIVSGIILKYGPESFIIIYDRWVGILTASTLMSLVQAVCCYIASFRPGALLALGGNSGNVIYDFFIGRELNPSVGSFDIKSFNELRPGLMLWVLINISMACKQAVYRGGLVQVTDSMWLVLAFQLWYVADSLYNEPALFTTMDITTDGFGFMLAIAITWVPFTYSVQARYLAFHPIELGPLRTAVIIGVNLLGYWIFRSSNGEKNDFRNGHNPKNLKFIETKRGTKLLTSGWWGLSQHPNYLGDLVMALAWSLPTGFKTPITYFYVSYFTVLLIHRQLRDDEACHQKYSDDWIKYKKLVPYRIIPYFY